MRDRVRLELEPDPHRRLARPAIQRRRRPRPAPVRRACKARRTGTAWFRLSRRGRVNVTAVAAVGGDQVGRQRR